MLLNLINLAFEINKETVLTSLDFMWKGMLGIMTVIVVITLIVTLMAKLDSKAEKKSGSQS
ncbi:MAG: hypothetical protein GXY95_05565 [Clostridiales bacterium]|jgi:hypothetical protein|nr:hypothetical protein [Clostridiales bacterium]HOA33405.1 hypothetical protein [Clostridiales bacterium]HOJ36112.1 hypothetical protein [Clostridiales bacterium]HOL78913.1 hypothetical protein [Clostridiales bacterium]HPP68594.1 hypothetical protein [Clostridiales bacterium]